MNTPFLLLGAAIMFWGWQTGQWLIAAACAIVFEIARFVPRRWNITAERWSRVSDLSIVVAMLLFAGFYVTLGNPRAITQLFLWMPLACAPLALAQAYGTQREIELGALFWSMRRMTRRRPTYVNLGYAYALAWIVAASAANQRESGFELGMLALSAWALWHVRPRTRPAGLWLLLVALAGGLSFAAHNGLHNLQLWLEANAAEWMRSDSGSNTDPYRAGTDMGHIGELKQSERIVARVRTSSVLLRPLLLHRASYVNYTSLRWLARGTTFAPVLPSESAGVWPLEQEADGTPMQTASIVEQTSDVDPVLSLPAGTRRIESLYAGAMKRNTLGAVQIEHRPGFVTYRALYVPGSAEGNVANADDLVIPRRETEMLQRVAHRLGLNAMTPPEALAAVERYLSTDFRYSMYRAETPRATTPLADFLEHSHAGHCEYFASATVLLLRAAGVPARYATGFSVQEWSELEKAYLVRQRHAHAWARVWMDGAWHDVDTTPASWTLVEAQSAPWWWRVSDLISWVRLKFFELQIAQGRASTIALSVAAAAVLWLVLRLFGRFEKLARPHARRRRAVDATARGTDSAFYRVEAWIAARYAPRAANETIREWFARIGPQLAQLPRTDELAALVRMHYRYRFDPAGVSTVEREQFNARVDAWLRLAQ